jgi:hypothetical protein
VSDVELVVLDDAKEVAAVLAERLARAAREGGSIVLTGGTTPEQAYEEAAKREPDWSKVEVWWSDERCVPPDHEYSNFGMVKRALLDRLDDSHKFEAPPSLIEEEFNLMWNSIKAEMESSGKTFADENTTEEAAQEEYKKIADRRVRLGLVLSEIGEKNKITVTDDEVSRAVIERARSMPGREKEVWDYYRNNANALAQLRAPIYEDKVVDFILELANVTEKKVSREDLFKDDETDEKSAA